MDNAEKVDVLDIAHQMVNLAENTVFHTVEFSENDQPNSSFQQIIQSEEHLKAKCLEQTSIESGMYEEEPLQADNCHIETDVIESVDFNQVLNETIASAENKTQDLNDSDTLLEESLLGGDVEENVQMTHTENELLEESLESEHRLLEVSKEINSEIVETQAETIQQIEQEVLEFEEKLLDQDGAQLEQELTAADPVTNTEQDEKLVIVEVNQTSQEEVSPQTNINLENKTEELVEQFVVLEECDESVNSISQQVDENATSECLQVENQTGGSVTESSKIQDPDAVVNEIEDHDDISIIESAKEKEQSHLPNETVNKKENGDKYVNEADNITEQLVNKEVNENTHTQSDSTFAQEIDTSDINLDNTTHMVVPSENVEDVVDEFSIDDKMTISIISEAEDHDADVVKSETEGLTDADNNEASNSNIVPPTEKNDDVSGVISEDTEQCKNTEDIDSQGKTSAVMEIIDVTEENDNTITSLNETDLESLNTHIMQHSDDNIEIYVIEENDEKLDEENADDPDIVLSDEDKSIIESKIIPDLLPIDQQKKRERALKQLESLSKKTTGNYVEVVDSKGQTTAKLPCHMLGRNLENPEVDVLSNGRAPPKPRLGVKVPNMNLTSQILSKEELTQEVMERNKKSAFRKPKRSILLKNKLSQRLANKLPVTPNKNDKKKTTPSKSKEPAPDCDLLAILEGDEEPDWSTLKSESNEHSSPPVLSAIEKTIKQHDSKNLIDPPILAVEEMCRPVGRKIITSDEAKQLAMKQLMELPAIKSTRSTRARGRAIESKQRNSDSRKQKQRIEDVVIPPIPKVQPKTYSNRKANDIINSLVNDWEEETVEESVSQSVQKIEQLKNVINLVKEESATNNRTENSDSVPERSKRKSLDVVGIVPNKRARIIKKKIIWDPADGSPRMSSPIISPTKKTRETSTKLNEAKTVIQNKSGKKIIVVSKMEQMSLTKQSPLSSTKRDENIQQKKRQEITPIKKKKSEIDKLLMDEGAVNMIYAVERRNNNTEIPEIITKPNKQSLVSRDDERKNLISKANLVKNTVLKQSTASVTSRSSKTSRLRKSPVPAAKISPSRKKSETQDSRRSSMGSPPPFEQSTFTYRDSRIIRRRSSSSFSSSASSPRRLSVDPDAKTIEDATLEVEESKKRTKGVPIFTRPNTNEKTYSGKRKRPSLNQEKPDESTEEPVVTKKVVVEQGKETVCAIPVSRRSTRSTASLESESHEQQSEDKLTKCLKEAANAFSTDNNETNQVEVSPAKRDRRSTVEKETEKLRSSRYGNSYKEISLRRHEGLVQIILTPTSIKFKNGLNMQALRELREALHNLQKDSACRVVLVTSSGSEFCHGLDYSGLVQTTAEKRKHAAQELANELKEFFRALVGFSKLIVAGVHGAAVGLGVTMLPLFDLVLASDKATFSVPATKNGHIPEGLSLLSHQQVLGHAAASELLLACRELTASEAVQHGLVSRVMWPDKFQADLIPTIKAMTTHSIPAMEATKAILRGTLRNVLDGALDNEEKQHIQMWTASECQENIKKAVQNGGW